jgi:hypothetical protein
VARPGLDIPWRLTLHAPPSGFPKQLTIAVSNRWWDIIEYQDLHPEPSDESATPKFVYLTFTPPDKSKTFSVSPRRRDGQTEKSAPPTTGRATRPNRCLIRTPTTR